MKLDHSYKFDLCYYGQVNSPQLKSSVTPKSAYKHLWGNIDFAGDSTQWYICYLYHTNFKS